MPFHVPQINIQMSCFCIDLYVSKKLKTLRRTKIDAALLGMLLKLHFNAKGIVCFVGSKSTRAQRA